MTLYFSGFYPSETAEGAKGSAAFLASTNIAIIQLYKRSATTLGNGDKPNGVVTYTFATANTDLSLVTNGWTTTIPSGSDPLYVVAATAASSAATDTIAVNEWATPVILVQNGTQGLSTATVFLFKRTNTSTPPAVPSQSATYTFASGTLIGTSSPGNTVSPFLDGWSQTAPDSAGNKYLFVTTATAISTGASDTITTSEWATVRVLAQDGAVGYTGYLTNESHTVPADTAGNVTSYSGATGDFKVFLDGVGDISSNFTLSVVANPQTLGNGASNIVSAPPSTTYTVSSGFDVGEDTAAITIRATGTGTYNGVILDKVFSLTKAKAGNDGTTAKIISLSSDRQLISFDPLNSPSPSTQTATLTVNKQNTSQTVNWTIRDTLGTVLTPVTTYLSSATGDSVTMTVNNFQSALSVNNSEGVVVTATVTDGSVVMVDRVTIMKVKAGTNGNNGLDGLNSATVYLYQRATSAPAVPAADSTYTFSTKILTGTLGSWSQTIPAGTNPIYVISATAASTTSTDVISTSEWSTPSVLAQNGTNGGNGLNSATVYLYQRAASAPAVPTGDSTYTFSSGVLTGTLGSWTQTIPAGTNPIYVISATASSSTSTDIIPTTEWAAPAILAQNGTNGTNGTNTAIVYLYQRATSAPAAPTGTFTYTFSSGLLTGGTPGSWTQTIPAGTNPLYVITATASSNTATDSVPAAEFSSPVIFVENGAAGNNGFNSAVVYLYQRSATAPAAPTGTFTYTFSSGLLTGGTPGSWTQTIPAGSSPLYVITATASSNTATDSILATEFSSPVIFVENGTNGTNSAIVYLYQRAASAPAAPTGTFTYTFSSGLLTGGTPGSWTQTIPTGTNPLYVITATASSNTATDSIPSTEFSSPVIFVENGGPGANGFNSAIVYLYQRAASTPAAPTGTFTYTFSTAALSGGVPGSWTQTIPAGTDPLYVITATASSNTTTDSIAAAEFSSPVIFTQNGAPGSNGTNSAIVYLYQRAASTPAAPSGTFTYTFSSGLLTGGTPGSWTQTIPSGTNPLYVITATASSNTATDSIAAAEFSSPVIFVENGAAGNNGFNSAIVYLYQRAASAPAAPTGTFTYTFSSGLLTGGTPGSWTQTIPTGTNPLYVITATASSNTATDSILATEFSSPVIFTQNGAPGSNGLNNAIVYLYQRAASTPAAPTGTFTYTFSTAALSGGVLGSWTQTIPAGTSPLYVIAATASSNTTTDTIAAAEFSSPVILAENGAPGNNGLNTALVYLYQRAASSPAAPTGTFTYTFSSAALSGGTLGSWTQTIPATNGNPLWVIVATASSSGTTDTIAAAEFSAPIILAQDGASITGPAAVSAYLTKESENLFAYADGTVVSFATANGLFKIMSGTTDVTASSDNFTVNASGCTANFNTALNTPVNGQPAGYYRVTAMSADTATVTLSARYPAGVGGTTYIKVYTLTKSKTGYEIVAALPTANLFNGRMAFLTATDGANAPGKLYRYVSGTGWTSAVPSVDLTGQITETQIAPDAITAPKIKAGEITAGKLYAGTVESDLIQANNIGAGVITAAKINVTELSALTANVGTLTAGTIRNAANTFRVDVTNGRTITQTGAYMKVTGAPFGSTNQFIEWFGPYNANLATCTQANAIYYLTTGGSAYFGGTLSAGILKNSFQTTSISPTAFVDLGQYGSNGGTITINLSYYMTSGYTATYSADNTGLNNYNSAVAAWGTTTNTGFGNTGSKSVTGSVVVSLKRGINGGALSQVSTLSLSSGTETLDGTPPTPGDAPGSITFTRTFSGSMTYTDPATIAQNRQYRADLTTRTSVSLGSNEVQTISLISTE